ncbi:hypothetical protein IGI04_024643 [Brassica rapa subsp. trilocularis]|uniref:ACB domain-containing protein n=1 Tax=Brassica rapa subsp. trilocularis TaxID=1813537 RepID=A0ABQ7M7A3_BRACM|nr:hypothetical protein IGI04_024643 [Brassica rapa subsp. trilocularis]
MEEKSWFGFCPSSSWINMSITKFWESRAFINLSLSPLNLESSFHADGSMRRSYKIRVTVLLNGYHVNPIPEVDLEGMEALGENDLYVPRTLMKAWRKLGAMSPEEAIEKYIEIVTQLYPTWLDGGLKVGSRSGGDDAVSNSGGAMGPVFQLTDQIVSVNQRFIKNSESMKTDAIHAFAREGEGEGEGGVDIEAEFLVKQKS